MPSVMFGETKIDYKTKISNNRKTIGISVDYDNGVIVTLPKEIAQEEIDKVVLQKAPWILDKLHEFSEVIIKPSENEFVSGEKYLYLGRAYRLKVFERENLTKPRLVFHRGKFNVEIKHDLSNEEQKKIVRKLILKWFLGKAESFLEERVEILSEKTGINPQGVKLREQQKRWGSCTKDNILIFNWLIIMAPVAVIDYIIIHELCHLKYPNHSDKFWKEVVVFCPDFQKRRDWLRLNGPMLNF